MHNDTNKVNPYVMLCGYINDKNCPKPGTDYGRRVVRWYEIELILRGEGFIDTEGTSVPANRGRIFFRRPGMVVRGVSPYHCYRVVFDMKFDENLLPGEVEYTKESAGKYMQPSMEEIEYFGFNFPDFFDASRIEKYEELFQGIYNSFVKSARKEQFVMKTYLQQILLLAYNEYSRNKSINTRRSVRINYPKVMTAKKYIDDNIQRQISLIELGSISELSPNFLCKIFKDIVGDSPIAYMNKCKIDTSKKLLLETDRTVKKIALECGFENYSYFFTMFRKLTGMTPLEYREQNSLFK